MQKTTKPFARIYLLFFTAILGAFLSVGCQSDVASSACAPKGKLYTFQDTTRQCGWGFKDEKGNVVIPPIYCHIFQEEFPDKIACVLDSVEKTPEGKFRLIAIDQCGNIVLEPFMYDNGPDYVREGVFRFVENGKIGFADKDGNIKIPAKFDFAGPFEQGMTAFCMGCKPFQYQEWKEWRGGKWGFMDKKGQVVIEPIYDYVGTFKGGLAQAQKDGAMFYIDTKGQRVE